MPQGLYIHIPFCKHKCPYCDFYSSDSDFTLIPQYIDIVAKEIKKINTPVTTVYIGGGTPTVVEVRLLEKLLSSFSGILQESEENTIEANPESISDDILKLCLGYNIKRVSIGVQSLRDEKLKLLKRVHDVYTARSAVRRAHDAGFTNISIDIMYGVIDESYTSWKSELAQAVQLPVTHMSCYALTFERRTPLYRLRSKVNDAVVAKMYEHTMQFLPKKGFLHYEVSNYAKPQYECRHNQGYWNQDDYIGIGPSSVSFQHSIRTKDIADVKEYIKRISNNECVIASSERLQPFKRAKEYAALKMRTQEGVTMSEFKQRTGFAFSRIMSEARVEELASSGFFNIKRDKASIKGISLTNKGFLFCDSIASELV